MIKGSMQARKAGLGWKPQEMVLCWWQPLASSATQRCVAADVLTVRCPILLLLTHSRQWHLPSFAGRFIPAGRCQAVQCRWRQVHG